MIQHPTPVNIQRENHNSNRHTHPSVHGNTVHNNQDMEATEMSLDRGMDKEDELQTHSAIAKNGTMPSAATQRALESVTLGEVSQRRRNIG